MSMQLQSTYFLLKNSLKVELLFRLKKFEKKNWDDFEICLQKIEQLKTAEINLTELIQKPVLIEGRILLPPAIKIYADLLKKNGVFEILMTEKDGKFPLVFVLRLFQELLKISPLLAGLLEESKLAGIALNTFPESDFNKESLKKLDAGELGGGICFDPQKSDRIEATEPSEGGKTSVKGALANLPLSNHDLFPENFFLHLAEHGKQKYSFYQIPFAPSDANGVFSLGMIEVDGSEFYTGNLLFGHPQECIAAEDKSFVLKEKSFQRLSHFSVLQSANTAIACAEIALEQTKRVILNSDEFSGKKLFFESNELTKMEAILSGIQSIAFSATFYFDLCDNPENPEKEYSQKICKILTLLAGSYCISEATEIFHHAESFIEKHHGFVFRDFATLRSLLRNARLRHSCAENCRNFLSELVAEEKSKKYFDVWLQEMHHLEAQVSETVLARESLMNWRESVAGFILFLDSFQEKIEGGEEEIFLQINIFIRYLGDVTAAYFSLKLLIEAEKEVQKTRIDPEENEELRFYYDRILKSEYFCLNFINRNEGNQKTVSRNFLPVVTSKN